MPCYRREELRRSFARGFKPDGGSGLTGKSESGEFVWFPESNCCACGVNNVSHDAEGSYGHRGVHDAATLFFYGADGFLHIVSREVDAPRIGVGRFFNRAIFGHE